MRVTSIVPIDKRKSKVFFDEGFALALYRGEIRSFHLEEGCELDEGVWRELLEILCRRARERALYLLKSRDRTEQEICRKLREGCYPQEAIDRTLAFLREYRFVDDEAYGRRYLEAYKESRSKRRIQYDLQKKGLSRQLITELFCDCPVSESEQIRRFLEKKGYRKGEATVSEKGKLAAALARKGFSFDAVYEALGD